MQAVSVKALRKTYRNGFEALRGVDLSVEEGAFYALLGPNGAGKSTLIGILSSLVNKNAGQVRVFGHDLDRSVEAVKASIGLVPQEFNFNLFLPPLEILINQAGYYGIPRRTVRPWAEELLHRVELWDKRSEEARKLSGGMKRRLMIARALVHRPRLLILDEPTAGVDIEIRRGVWGFLRALNRQGTTIILTTHYLEEAESLCGQVAIIDQGRIVEQAATRTLIDRLASETFVLNLRGDLAEVPELGGFVLQHLDSSTLEVSLTREQTVNGLFDALSRNGVEVLSLRNKQNRLEQLFLSLVERGRNAEEVRP